MAGQMSKSQNLKAIALILKRAGTLKDATVLLMRFLISTHMMSIVAPNT